MTPDPDHKPDAGAQALTDALQASFRLLRMAMLLLFLAYLASGLFVVRQHEKAFVLLLGKISGLGGDRVKQPGFHWTWPKPFSEIVRIPAERVDTLTTPSFWHRALPASQEEASANLGPTLNPEVDGYVLTGDANILHARWAVRYTVRHPEYFLFGFDHATRVLAHELDRAVVHVCAAFSIERALRTDLSTLRDEVEKTLAARAEELGLGLSVQGVDLLSTIPSPQVAQAFDAVIQAEQERGTQISQARAYAARTVNEAEGEAERMRVEGETYQQRLVSEISADADRFRKMLGQYARHPQVFSQTLLQDSLRRALAQVEAKYVVQDGASGKREIRLQLGPERQEMK